MNAMPSDHFLSPVPTRRGRPLVFGALFVGLLGLAGSSVHGAPAVQRESAPIEHLNLSKGLALDGFDPVAYFPQGGSKAKEGKKALSVALRGVTYRFVSEKNMELFLADPESFEPDYGGWCAWAMTKNDKVEVDPESFLIEEGRLLVFYDGFLSDTRKSWLKRGGKVARPLADKNWDKLVGKLPQAKKQAKPSKLRTGLEGNDPLSYGRDRSPEPGLASITTKIGGLEYRFANKGNRLTFLRDPEAYLMPARGQAK